MARALTSINGAQQTHIIWMLKGSFFWNNLMKIRPLFDWSTEWEVASGKGISYWFDSWFYPTMSSIYIALLAFNRNWLLEKAVQ